jgi:hypothetical protein
MATPSSGHGRACNVISNVPVKPDASAENTHGTIRFSNYRNINSSNAWGNLDIYPGNVLGIPTGTHIRNIHSKSPMGKSSLDTAD